MLVLLALGGWTPAGCVRGVNEDESAECFFCREVTDAEPLSWPPNLSENENL